MLMAPVQETGERQLPHKCQTGAPECKGWQDCPGKPGGRGVPCAIPGQGANTNPIPWATLALLNWEFFNGQEREMGIKKREVTVKGLTWVEGERDYFHPHL